MILKHTIESAALLCSDVVDDFSSNAIVLHEEQGVTASGFVWAHSTFRFKSLDVESLVHQGSSFTEKFLVTCWSLRDL